MSQKMRASEEWEDKTTEKEIGEVEKDNRGFCITHRGDGRRESIG